MQKLVDLKEPEIWRGAIFRVKGSRPYEAARPLGMMVATGYSAGHTFLHLPLEALVSRDKAISTAWLKGNWMQWVYPECPVEEVLFIERYVIQQ